MGKRKSKLLLNHHKASCECLVHTAGPTFALKTFTKVPWANITSSPLLVCLRQLVQQHHQHRDNQQLLTTPLPWL